VVRANPTYVQGERNKVNLKKEEKGERIQSEKEKRIKENAL